MKRLLAISLLLCVMVTCISIDVLAEGKSIISEDIDLTTVSDDELAQAISILQAEQKSRIKTKLQLSSSNISVAKGKKENLSYDVIGLADGVTVEKISWSSTNEKIVKVQNGAISGIGGGKADIICSAQLSDGSILSESCTVTVIVAATSISIKQKEIILDFGKTATINVDFKPDDVSNKKVQLVSADDNIVSVESDGKIKALQGGKTTITATTTDGSNKSAKVTVYVSSIAVNSTDYSVESKDGKDITLKYYGKESNLSVTGGGANAAINYSLDGDDLTLSVTPIKAGKASIVIADKSNAKSKVTLNVMIEHSAVYDTQSYPKIQYTEAYRYPDRYDGENVSFSGRVLQVMDVYLYTILRVSSRGRWDDVVYVTIDNDKITTPILEDDNITVFGTYDGNYTYETIMGGSVTIPSVDAERINVK